MDRTSIEEVKRQTNKMDTAKLHKNIVYAPEGGERSLFKKGV